MSAADVIWGKVVELAKLEAVLNAGQADPKAEAPRRNKLYATISSFARDRKSEAATIVATLQRFVTECRPEHRTTAVWAMDAIMKATKGDPTYPHLFSPLFPSLLSRAFESASPESRVKMGKVLDIWLQLQFLSPQEHAKLQMQMQQVRAVPVAQGPRAQGQPSTSKVAPPRRSPEPPAKRMKTETAGAGRPTVQEAARSAPPARIDLLNPGDDLPPPPPPSVAEVHPQIAYPAQYDAPAYYESTGADIPPPPPPSAPAYPSYYQQPAYASDPYYGGDHQQGGGYSRPAREEYGTPPIAPQAGGPAPVAPAAAVLAAGQLPGQRAGSQPVPPGGAQGADVTASDLWAMLEGSGLVGPDGAPLAGGGRKPSAAFTPEFLRDHHEFAVQALLSSSERMAGRWFEREFLRRQRELVGQESKQRSYYVPQDVWLQACTPQALQPALDEAEAAAEGAAAAGQATLEGADFTEPADEGRRTCALSGESFEAFFDERHGQWRYRDCISLVGEFAAQFGLEDGSYVLASTISDRDLLAEIALSKRQATAGHGQAAGPEGAAFQQVPGAVKLEELEEPVHQATGAAMKPEDWGH